MTPHPIRNLFVTAPPPFGVSVPCPVRAQHSQNVRVTLASLWTLPARAPRAAPLFHARAGRLDWPASGSSPSSARCQFCRRAAGTARPALARSARRMPLALCPSSFRCKVKGKRFKIGNRGKGNISAVGTGRARRGEWEGAKKAEFAGLVVTSVVTFRHPRRKPLIIRVADGGGFEPPLPCGKHAFQACAIDHSATHPKLSTCRCVEKTNAPDFAERNSAAKTPGSKRDVGSRVESLESAGPLRRAVPPVVSKV